ncbi:MAG TPA: L-lactate permease [Puia sp.]|nr:L-lactate permease [Puia sp.]
MPSWSQVIDPCHNRLASLAIALIPVLVIFWALVIRRMKGYLASLLAVGCALVVAGVVYRMPVSLALLSAANGALYGLFPICWIVFPAVLLFNITVKSGQFTLIRHFLASITDDRRIQALLIAFSFGAFLEGTAGFGAPVAITAAMLTGLGFQPLYAAGICLIANTAPVAFGSIGIPIAVIAQVTGLPEAAISQLVGRTLPVLSALLPFYLVTLMAGYRAARAVAPAALTAGLSFAIIQAATANLMGPTLPDILAGVGSIVCLLVLLRFWQPKAVWRFANEAFGVRGAGTGPPGVPEQVAAASRSADGAGDAPREGAGGVSSDASGDASSDASGDAPGDASGDASRDASGDPPGTDFNISRLLWALGPYIALTAIIVIWGIPAVKDWLNAIGSRSFEFPGLHHAILDMWGRPIAHIYRFNYLSAAGTAIALAAVISWLVSGLTAREAGAVLRETSRQMSYPVLSIAAVLAFAYLANDSGITLTIAEALATSGILFPVFAPLLGWLGVFITGSDTSSNALFGKLQATTAGSIGVDPLVTVSANVSGGVVGKMISPQSIAVAAAAGGLVGRESALFRFTVRHSFILLAIISLLVVAQAYLLKWIVPAYTVLHATSHP